MFGVGRSIGQAVKKPLSPIPPVLSGLYFWLDAQDPSTLTLVSGKVSAWADKSANNFGFSQSTAAVRPAYDATLFGGRGGVTFDFSTGGGMLSNAAATGLKINTFTYFLVGIRTDAILSAIMGDFGSGQNFGPTNHNNRYGIGEGAQTLQGVPIGVPYIMGFKTTGAYTTSKFFDASGTQYSVVPGTGGVPSSSSDMAYVSFGGKDFGAGNGFSMTFATMFMYNRDLTDSEISQMCAWIRSKYQIAIPTPSSILVDFSGDSIASGFYSEDGGGPAYAEIAMESLGYTGSDYLVSAVGGQTVPESDSTDTSLVDPLYNASLAANVVCIFCGTNDLNTAGSLSSLETNIQTYCANRRAAGFKVIVSTVLPRSSGSTSNPSFETDRTDYNTWLQANYTSFADGICDPASDATMGDVTNTTNTTYYFDGVHPTALGHSLIAPYFATAIGPFL